MRALLLLPLLALPTLAGDPFLPTTPGKPGSFAIVPVLTGEGPLTPGSPDNAVLLSQAAKNTTATVVIGFTELAVPFKGGIFGPDADLLLHGLNVGPTGEAMLPFTVPEEAPPGFELWTQMWVQDIGASFGLAASNTLKLTIQESNPTKLVFPDATYAVGAGPRRMRSADLDGDGDADLVVVNELSNSLTILYGQGGGLFGSPVEILLGTRPRAIEIADFDENGTPDIAVANRISDEVSILLGNGNGNFAAEVRYPAGLNPTGMVVHDLDGDGHLDLAFANESAIGQATILLGAGDGTFTAGAPVPTGMNLLVAIDAADLDGDGIVDLAISRDNGQLRVFKGMGGGAYSLLASYAAGGPQFVSFEHLDDDGILDLLTLRGDFTGGSIALWFGNGDGTFGSPEEIPVDGPARWAEYVDIDSDGLADLLVCMNTSTLPQDGRLLLYPGLGAGQFGPAVELGIGPDPRGFVAEDLDGDDDVDVAVISRASDEVAVLRGNGAGGLGPAWVEPISSAAAVALGHLDDDEYIDVVGAASGGQTVVLFGDGAGGTLSVGPPIPFGGSLRDILLHDLDEDGVLDLVAATGNVSNGMARVALGQGGGSFAPAVAYPVGDTPTRVIAADFDDDGVVDIATANSGLGTVSVLLGNGDGTFTTLGGEFPAAAGTRDLAAADVDADGVLDIVTANTVGDSVSVLIGLGNGFFLPPVTMASGDAPGVIELIDFDDDGSLDIVTLDGGTNTLSWFAGNSSGGFAAPQGIAIGETSGLGCLADIDGDGRLDLATAIEDGTALRVVMGIGLAGFSLEQQLTISTELPAGGINDVVIGQLTGAGPLDIVLARQSGAIVTHVSVGDT